MRRYILKDISQSEEIYSKRHHLNNVRIKKINVNSFPDKFDSFKLIIPGNIAVMVIRGTKIDHS